jgi:hypothetical protein
MTLHTALGRLLLPLPLLVSVVVGCSSSDEAEGEPSGASQQEVTEPQVVERLEWPRVLSADGATVVIHQPQIQSWDAYATLVAKSAVEVTPDGAEAPSVGVIELRAFTTVDFDERSVVVFNTAVADARFPTLSVSDGLRCQRWVEQAFHLGPIQVSLDRVLAAVKRDMVDVSTVQISYEPPPIYVSRRPAILVIYLGDPVYRAVDGSSLEYVLNTNWNLIRDPASGTCYLLVGESWLQAQDPVQGPWTPAGELPDSFSALPQGEEWAEVREQVPGEELDPDDVPAVFTTTQPAELIVIDGAEEFESIPGTALSYVSNTNSDLFRLDPTGPYYLLIAGRWFTADICDGPWYPAGPRLPLDFMRIPSDHVKAPVKASVPGTPDAEEAVIMASIPRQAEVQRTAGADVEVSYVDGEPQFVLIEGTSVYFASNTSNDVFRCDDRYYLCLDGVWFVSDAPTGPWVVADMIPAALYSIPSTHPKHHVTYVVVYSSTPTTVVVGYTGGYVGSYVAAGVVVWGTGYAWGYYHAHHYHYYGHYHYAYGYHAYYSHYHGGYVAGGYYYGPYGGAGWRASYNPHTGTYARGGGVYGPYGGSAWAGSAYNPYTGAYARAGGVYGPNGYREGARAYNPQTNTGVATRQGGNHYSSWGQSAVRRGNEWARTAHYSDSRGTAAGFQTSRGAAGAGYRGDNGSGGVVRTSSGDLYVGRDGEVYRRNSDGSWDHHGDGGWDPASSGARARAEAGGYDGSRASDARARAEAGGYDGSRASDARSSRGTSDRSYGGADRGTMGDLSRTSRSRSRGESQHSRYSGSSSRYSGSSSRSSGARGSRGSSRSSGGSRSGGRSRGGGRR